MSWNYRLVERHGFFAVHEAFYDEAGQLRAWTVLPVTVTGETVADIEAVLARMLADVRRHSPIVEPAKGAEPRPAPGLGGREGAHPPSHSSAPIAASTNRLPGTAPFSRAQGLQA